MESIYKIGFFYFVYKCDKIVIYRIRGVDMGTFIVVLVLVAIVAAIIRSIVKTHKNGGHPICGGDCGNCHGGCSHSL